MMHVWLDRWDEPFFYLVGMGESGWDKIDLIFF